MATPLRGREKRSRTEEAPALDFELLWRSAPSLLLVLDAGPAFTVLDASDAYLQVTDTSRERIVGRGFFDVFPETAQAHGPTGVASSRAALERVLATGRGDGFNSPVLAADGSVRYLIHRLDTLDPGVVRRARERDEMLGQLERANEELDAFVQSTSHGLQTSLRAIDSFCRLFEKMRANSLDEGVRRLLMRIAAQVNRMDTIIEGLLGLSNSGRSHISRRRVDVTAVARRVAEQWKGRTPSRTVSVHVAGGMEAWADETLLVMALEHLIGNAWKFTRLRPDAHVDIGARQVSGQTVFHVRDNGVGFDMGAADKLFSPFVRLHGAGDFDGHGIGLATVRRIVERHGGAIWAESQPGAGATFFFTLSGTRAIS
ncbi:MAG: sensor histidine kinase [Betaproteobacteria bacterium]